jgi:hypothetical protein
LFIRDFLLSTPPLLKHASFLKVTSWSKMVAAAQDILFMFQEGGSGKSKRAS